MSIFSDSFKVALWFFLCVGMALGMVIFAILYSFVSFSLKKLAWKEINFTIPSLRLANK